jgi:hypothetical protein
VLSTGGHEHAANRGLSVHAERPEFGQRKVNFIALQAGIG